MKKRYGIGFLIGSIVFTLVLVCAYQFSYDRALRKMEAEKSVRTEGTAKKEDGFVIKEKEGLVMVYLADGTTVYEDTSIVVADLPENIQKELKEGKQVKTVGQVYGFLENYSS